MAEADLSKIVNLIMENPKLIEEIKSLASQKPSAEEAEVSEPSPDIPDEPGESVTASTYKSSADETKARRNGLLAALKPYLSNKRSQAIDSMMSIADIIDVVRSR